MFATGPGLSHQPGNHRRLLTESISGASGDAFPYQRRSMKDKSNSEFEALRVELQEVLTAKTEMAIVARKELRDAVCRYVDAEQSRGTSLTLIILTVKDILAKAERESTHGTDELAQQLIDWCEQFHGKRIALVGETS